MVSLDISSWFIRYKFIPIMRLESLAKHKSRPPFYQVRSYNTFCIRRQFDHVSCHTLQNVTSVLIEVTHEWLYLAATGQIHSRYLQRTFTYSWPFHSFIHDPYIMTPVCSDWLSILSLVTLFISHFIHHLSHYSRFIFLSSCHLEGFY